MHLSNRMVELLVDLVTKVILAKCVEINSTLERMDAHSGGMEACSAIRTNTLTNTCSSLTLPWVKIGNSKPAVSLKLTAFIKRHQKSSYWVNDIFNWMPRESTMKP